jgi:hypothetical protein
MKNTSKPFGIEINVQTGEVTQVELPEVIDEATPE